jgi:hypothetical protein
MEYLLILLPCKTIDKIQKKTNQLGLYKPDSLLWDNEEVEILKTRVLNKTIKELLEIFYNNNTKTQINKKTKRFKLKKRL